MATTSSSLTGGAAIGGRGGNGPGRKARVAGLVATAAVGLGLLTGVVLGRAHQAAAPAGGQGASPQALAVPSYQSSYRFLEQNALPELAVRVKAGDLDGPRFLEQNLALPAVSAARPSGSDQQRFLEWNTQLPTGGAPAPFVPDQLTYREDHRASAAALATPDQFTYREDHRGER